MKNKVGLYVLKLESMSGNNMGFVKLCLCCHGCVASLAVKGNKLWPNNLK